MTNSSPLAIIRPALQEGGLVCGARDAADLLPESQASFCGQSWTMPAEIVRHKIGDLVRIVNQHLVLERGAS